MNFTEAVAFVRNPVRDGAFDENAYKGALEVVGDNLDQLKGRLNFELPGGLGGNSDPKWNNIKAKSKERCSCGNERTFMPANPRTEFKAGASVSFTMGQKFPIRPVGGDKASTYTLLEIIKGDNGPGLTMLSDPYGPLILTPDLIGSLFGGPKGYMLNMLADAVVKIPETKFPPTFFGPEKIPMAQLVGVDLETNSIALVLDEDCETFNPETEPDSSHKH